VSYLFLKSLAQVDYSDVQKSVPVKLARLLLDITIGCCFDSHPRIDSVLQNSGFRYGLLENAIPFPDCSSTLARADLFFVNFRSPTWIDDPTLTAICYSSKRFVTKHEFGSITENHLYARFAAVGTARAPKAGET
jgi:hypothetical protein